MSAVTKVAMLVDPHRVELVSRELPPLEPRQARVRVTECGLCTSEVDLWAGKAPDELPRAIGHELAGVVEELGSEVTTLKPGQHVAAWVEGGGFAEQIILEDRFCIPVADGAPYPAVAEPLACVVNSVELAAPRLADDVVIIGAGFMGNLVQMVTTLKGPRSITVADVRADALERAQQLGATRVVDTRSESLVSVVDEVTAGRGADLTYEVTGVNAGLELAGEVTRMSGKLCIVGYHQGGERTVRLAHWNWMAFELVNAHFRSLETIMTGMRAGLRLVGAGLIDASSLVTHTYPLKRIEDAFEEAAKKAPGFVKAVVAPDAETG